MEAEAAEAASATPIRSVPPADPAVVDRGKTIYGAQCAFCHGQDARGGSEGGPSLIRSEVVLKDQNGELIAPVVQNGRPGMPKFDLTAAQVSDIAAFLHSFRVSGYDAARNRPPSILVGDAKAGEATSNPSAPRATPSSGDLKGFGAQVHRPAHAAAELADPGRRRPLRRRARRRSTCRRPPSPCPWPAARKRKAA